MMPVAGAMPPMAAAPAAGTVPVEGMPASIPGALTDPAAAAAAAAAFYGAGMPGAFPGMPPQMPAFGQPPAMPGAVPGATGPLGEDGLPPPTLGAPPDPALSAFALASAQAAFLPAADPGPHLLRLRGLPFGTSAEQVCEFLAPIPVDPRGGVHMIRGPDGRPGGEAFVWMRDAFSVQQARTYDRRPLGRRYVEVLPGTEEELREAVNRQGQVDCSSGCLRLRGIPFDAGKREVCDFLRGYGVAPEHVTLQEVGGRHTGEAWVKFPGGEAAAREALEHLQNQRIGNRYIELFPSREPGDQEPPALAQQKPLTHTAGSGYVRVRGLPFQAVASDVARFFEAYGVTAQHVQLRLNFNGRSMGEGIVQMDNEEVARRAVQEKNRNYLFGRYLELFTVSYEEAQAFGQPPQPVKGFPTVEGAAYIRLRGLPFSVTAKDIVTFLNDIEQLSDDQVQLGRSSDGRMTGEAWAQMKSTENADKAIASKQRGDIGGRYVELFTATEEEAHSMGGANNPRALGAVWVKVRGLPYSAVPDDLAQFFSDFEVKSANVVMGRGADQRATGEAWVQFPSEDKASKAISTRDRGHIGGRYVELFPATSHEVQRITEQQRVSNGGTLGLSPTQGAAYLKLRGIPYSATPQDVAQFLEGFHVMPGQVAIGKGADGRPSGDAWVQLADERTASAAMQAKNKGSLGGRYVEIFPSNFQEALRASGGVGLEGYGPAGRAGGARSSPYGDAGAAAAFGACGACGAGACAGMPGMGGWMYPSSYPVGMTMDPTAAAAAAAAYGAAGSFGQYGTVAQYGAAQYTPAQYSAAAAAAAAQYGAVAGQYGAGVAAPGMQYMVAGYGGGMTYPMLAGAAPAAPQTAPAAAP